MRSVHSTDPLSMAEILEDDVELVEIQDAVPKPIRAFAAAVMQTRRLGAPLWALLDNSQDPAPECCETSLAPLADVEGQKQFAAWLRHWVAGFASLNDNNTTGLRVSHLRAPMCPRFHVDQVPTRMIVTLEGAGTEWLPANATATLGEDGQCNSTDAVRQLAPGSVGLFKGSGFDDGRARGVIHRSPSGAEDRLVMTLDAVL